MSNELKNWKVVLGALLFVLVVILSCSQENTSSDITQRNEILAVDISSIPEIRESNDTFFDSQGSSESILTILKDKGVNTIRLRLWVEPITSHSSLDEVASFSSELQSLGFDIWLSIHYSDTWADPGQQIIPATWQDQSLDELTLTVYNYTQEVLTRIQPTYVQIGNEINNGLLHPIGVIDENPNGFFELLNSGIRAAKDYSEDIQIILHYAGHTGSDFFFEMVSAFDYDIIGLSFYPIWHGKSLMELEQTMIDLSIEFSKPVVIAETAYPFTLDWNDQTHNIVGLQSQLILPDYPASPEGQKLFIRDLRNMVNSNESMLGFCYWGAELVAWKGFDSLDASPWENQALFDFNNHALPVLNEFSN